MRKKLLSFFALLWLMVSSASAAEVIYSSNDIGKLIGSDGNVYAAANDVPSGVTVSGMIAYINTSDPWGLVISPVDLNYNGTEGSEKSTQSQAVAACSGYNRPRPLAAISSWRLPSQDDFNRMIGTDGCGSADNLRNLQGPNSVSCINNDKAVYGMKTDDGYWSSTETATTGVYYNLWGNDCGSIASGDEHPKYVRPCFTISCKEITYIDHSVSGEAAQRVSTLTSVLSATVVPCTHGNYTFAGTPNPMVTCHYCGIAAFEDAGEHNTETIAALSSQADPVNVILSGRTLYKDGNWNTLCLPFAVSDFTGTPLEGATVKTLESSSFAGGTLTMNFTEDANNLAAIQAGKPYIVKWTKSEGYDGHENDFDIANPVFTGVTISSTTAGSAPTNDVDFIGTYSPESLYESGTDKTKLYLGNGNTLNYTTSTDFKVNAFRGYFQLKNDLTAGEPSSQGQQNARSFVLNFGDGEQTGISTLPADAAPATDGIYTLDGRRLSGMPTKSGLYIVNGKKVVTK